MKFVIHGRENMMGQGENAGKAAFSSFPTMFLKAFFLRVVESWHCAVKGQCINLFPNKSLFLRVSSVSF